MLSSLFGNRNIERVLFFLFVNERCYGSQLHTLLNAPLTPLQRALSQLEQKGILMSHYERKARVYQFNPSFPLRWELENLLKTAYTLLPPQEKKQYCFVHKRQLSAKEEGKRERNRKKELTAFWERLLKVSQLSLIAKSRQEHASLIKTGKASPQLAPISSNLSMLTCVAKTPIWEV